jgi:hypothetical protein
MSKINLFVNHFQCGNNERQKELDFCFNHNSNYGYFDKIINFSDRPTYNDFFEATKEYPNDINILSNSDIYFTESILRAKTMSFREAYALTRWEIDEEGNIVPFEAMHLYNKEAKAKYSQDVWVFRGEVKGVNGYFHIGKRGCDNRIAYEIERAGYRLTNPSNRIQCVHKHKESGRAYTMTDVVPRPYKFVEVEGSKKRGSI